jgi:peptidoglycan/xylan/chitin deacetylase (PgdA/CDA1 family)
MPAAHAACKPLYLTLDTGNMRDALAIADFLRERDIRATFFLANEKTVQGGYAMDESWASYWRDRVREGHVFGTHTWRHGRIFPDASAGAAHVAYKPQFGEKAGQRLDLTPAEFCAELNTVSQVFRQYTGQSLSGIWRAPGGKLSTAALAAGRQCGFVHVGWSETGFLGDELDSKKFPNSLLVQRAFKQVRSGDILLAHLGIWSRQELFLPAFKQIVAGLQDKGFCFKTLRDHPDYASAF